MLKGILSPEDARLAVSRRGRHHRLEPRRAPARPDPATADALEDIVEAVDGRLEVWVDGGIRRGLDVAIALALGATGVLVGRPFYWALAAGGQAGVERAVAILREELELALPLLGCTSPADLQPELVRRRRSDEL